MELAAPKPGWSPLLREHARLHAPAALGLGLALIGVLALLIQSLAQLAGGNAAVANLAASVLTLAAKLEQAWAENAAHVLDVARLAEALDPLREIVAYGSVNNDPRLWTEVRD